MAKAETPTVPALSAPSLLILIDDVDQALGEIKTLIEATEAETTEDSRQHFHDAYDAFIRSAPTLGRIEGRLRQMGYPDPEAVNRSGLDKPQPPYCFGKPAGGYKSMLLDWLRQLEGDLLKARKWCKAQKQPKRKREDDPYVWLNASGAARYVGTTSKTITTWIRQGKLNFRGQDGTSYEFLQTELDTKKAAFKPRKSRKAAD
jgi:hypothetical protein